MQAKRFYAGAAIGLLCSIGILGCGEKKEAAPAVVEEEVEEQKRREEEESRRQGEVTALAGRAQSLRSAMGGAAGQPEAGSGALPAKLDEALSEARNRLAEAERGLEALRGASGGAWEAARAEVAGAMDALESTWQQASAALADWESREAAALAASGQGPARYDSATGLIRGLDGSAYPPYRPATVERVQARMRLQGLYAGPVHGHLDQGTMDAIARFQEAEGLGASGVPSPRTRHRLFEHPH